MENSNDDFIKIDISELENLKNQKNPAKLLISVDGLPDARINWPGCDNLNENSKFSIISMGSTGKGENFNNFLKNSNSNEVSISIMPSKNGCLGVNDADEYNEWEKIIKNTLGLKSDTNCGWSAGCQITIKHSMDDINPNISSNIDSINHTSYYADWNDSANNRFNLDTIDKSKFQEFGQNGGTMVFVEPRNGSTLEDGSVLPSPGARLVEIEGGGKLSVPGGVMGIQARSYDPKSKTKVGCFVVELPKSEYHGDAYKALGILKNADDYYKDTGMIYRDNSGDLIPLHTGNDNIEKSITKDVINELKFYKIEVEFDENGNAIGEKAVECTYSEYLKETQVVGNGINGNLSLKYLENDSGNSKVASDVSILFDKLNIIRKVGINDGIKSLTTSSYVNKKHINENANNIGTEQMANVVNYYNAISTDMFSHMKKFTDLVANIGQIYYETDQQLKALEDSNGLSPAKYKSLMNESLEKVYNDREMVNKKGHSFYQSCVNYSKYCTSTNSCILELSDFGLPTEVLNQLDDDIANSKLMHGQLSNLKDELSSENFSGEVWNYVMEDIDTYSNVLNQRANAAIRLKFAYKRQKDFINEYLNEDPVCNAVDYSKLGEFEQEYINLQKAKEDAEYKLTAVEIRYVPQTYHIGNKEFTYGVLKKVPMFSAEDIAAAAKLINDINNELPKLKKNIEKLKKLPKVLKDAEAIVNEAMKITYDEYDKLVINLAEGNQSEYIHPSNTNITYTDV